jgi:hypothetical protein
VASGLRNLRTEATYQHSLGTGTEAELVGSSQLRTDFFQIIYDDSQRKECYEFALVYHNQTLTPFFENSVISELVGTSKADKIAVCSWKLKQKLKWYIGKPQEITPELLESDYEVMSFTKNTSMHRMFAAAEANHKGFVTVFKKICDAIGVKFTGEVKIPIYQNHFSAKREIYHDYVKEYLNPAMEIMQNDPEINKLVMADSNYSTLTSKRPEHLKEIEHKLGIGYYPLAPFLLERLFSVFVQNEKINVSWL